MDKRKDIEKKNKLWWKRVKISSAILFYGFLAIYASSRSCREVINSQVSYALNPRKHATLLLDKQKESLESITSSAPTLDIVRTGVTNVTGKSVYFEEWRHGAVLYYNIDRDENGKAIKGDLVTKADLNALR